MAGLFDVRVKDLGVRERLRKAKKLSTANLTVAMEQIGQRWMRLVDRGFIREEDPYGNSWEPNAAATVEEKGHGKVLQDSGKMRASFGFHATSRGLTLFNDRDIFPDGTDASIHQTGGQGEFRIPPRPMVPDMDGEGIPDEWWEIAKNQITYALGRYMDDE